MHHMHTYMTEKKNVLQFTRRLSFEKKKKKSWVASVEGFRPGIEPGFFERQSNTLPLCERSIHMT